MREGPGVEPTGTTWSNDRPAKLFDDHADRLYRLARRLAPSADEALDLVQEVFLRVAKSPHAVPRGPRDEEAWLVRVLVNIRRDQWRRESVRRRTAEHVRPPESTSPSPEGSYVRCLTIWRALDALSPRRRAIVVLHEIEALPASTIASLLGISAITVRWHLAMGRRELARELRTDRGVTHDEPDAALARGRPSPPRRITP